MSRFQVDHGLLLNLMQHADETDGDAAAGHRVLLDLIEQSHTTARQKLALQEDAERLLEDLTQAGVVRAEEDGSLRLAPNLQRNFSLHHSLSLFLVDALDALDPQSENYALDVVSLTEAILEQPRVVLHRQADRVRDALYRELKASGVPYEDRVEPLREVSWPRPQADWIFGLFNTYATAHPWVKGEDIRPKCVVRDMLEQYAGFSTYIQDLGLERSEGVLLRYVTDVYKALFQNVPVERHTDALLDVLAFLRAMLARVDSSLVTEWERLVAGRDLPTEGEPALVDISKDRPRFHARIRAELHALVRALAGEDWDEVRACLRPGDAPWESDDLEQALEPFHEEFGPLLFNHQARLTQHTVIRETGPLQWEVSQRLLDPEDEGAWSIDGTIDLRGDTNPPGPLITLLGIGE